jgi:CheY-like chemotaxis protein
MNGDGDRAVLLIDDNEAFGRRLREALSVQGYTVAVCGTVDEVVARLKEGPAPPFILADRMLAGVAIERGGLQALRGVLRADQIVIVYTNVADLTAEEAYELQEKGATRVLDKVQIDALVEDVGRVEVEFRGLLALADELRSITEERARIAAALVGANVGVAVIDRNYKCWFANAELERLVGGQCASTLCWRGLYGVPVALGRCWGCAVAAVFAGASQAERLMLCRFRPGVTRWVQVRSSPVCVDGVSGPLAVREAVCELSEEAVAALGTQRRLAAIGRGLVHMGFGRVRIYEANLQDEGRLVLAVAAARSDQLGEDGELRGAAPAFIGMVVQVKDCPYASRAYAEKRAQLVESWDPALGGRGTWSREVGCVPPYFDVPILDAEGRLCAWLSVDFEGLEGAQLESAKAEYLKKETGDWLQSEYGAAIERAIASHGHGGLERERGAIVERAKLAVGSASSVVEAMKGLRGALEELLPGCRVTVRRMVPARQLRVDPELSVGGLDEAPAAIDLADPRSLAARAVNERRMLWLHDLKKYRASAEAHGDALGYAVAGTASSAQVPLMVEGTVYGCLSISSAEPRDWEKEAYVGAIQALAALTALVLRDIAGIEQNACDREGLIAYASMMTSSAPWRVWARRRMLLATSELQQCLEAPDATALSPSCREHMGRALATVREAAKDDGDMGGAYCYVPRVIECLSKMNPERWRRVTCDEGTGLPPLRAPEGVVVNVLQVLLENALEAVERQYGAHAEGEGKVSITARALGRSIHIAVTDNGPGIADAVVKVLFRAKTPSASGAGTSLLAARGAALAIGGDLVLDEHRSGARVRLIVPVH